MTAKNANPAVATIEALDPIWTAIRSEAEDVVEREPALAGFVYAHALNHDRLEDAVAHRVADRLSGQGLDAGVIRGGFAEMFAADPDLSVALRADMMAVYDRDPACTRFIEPLGQAGDPGAGHRHAHGQASG